MSRADLELSVGLQAHAAAEAVPTSVCWISARPISTGTPACFIESAGLAPVPPSQPLMRILSALSLGNACGNGAHARFGHEFHADERPGD